MKIEIDPIDEIEPEPDRYVHVLYLSDGVPDFYQGMRGVVIKESGSTTTVLFSDGYSHEFKNTDLVSEF